MDGRAVFRKFAPQVRSSPRVVWILTLGELKPLLEDLGGLDVSYSNCDVCLDQSPFKASSTRK